jgi:hypothetical protein
MIMRQCMLRSLAAGTLGASGGWRLAGWLALEWLPFRNGVRIGKDAARQLSFGFSEAWTQASAGDLP